MEFPVLHQRFDNNWLNLIVKFRRCWRRENPGRKSLTFDCYSTDVVTTCGGTVTLKNTYWQSPSTGVSASSTCALKIRTDSTIAEQSKKPIFQIRWVFFYYISMYSSNQFEIYVFRGDGWWVFTIISRQGIFRKCIHLFWPCWMNKMQAQYNAMRYIRYVAYISLWCQTFSP